MEVAMREFFKRLMCKHSDMQHVRNIHGDEINFRGGKRSVWQCANCGAIKLRDHLHYEPKETTHG
jgi:RNase P subunit RPR2